MNSNHERSNRWTLCRQFLREREHPERFYRTLANNTLASFPFTLADRTVLDLGAGPGYFSRALSQAGARVFPVDVRDSGLESAARDLPAAWGDAAHLPFIDGSFDGVFCSNVLEHTPDTERLIAEIERVLVPGGWAWVSWTNWLSPWGGHAIAPLHYLGPRLGLRVWKRLIGEPRGPNVPLERLWPTYIGRTLKLIRNRAELETLDVVPRYYPSQRWIMKIPGFREVAAWNCLVLLRKRSKGE